MEMLTRGKWPRRELGQLHDINMATAINSHRRRACNGLAGADMLPHVTVHGGHDRRVPSPTRPPGRPQRRCYLCKSIASRAPVLDRASWWRQR